VQDCSSKTTVTIILKSFHITVIINITKNKKRIHQSQLQDVIINVWEILYNMFHAKISIILIIKKTLVLFMDSFLIFATIIYLNPGYGLYQTWYTMLCCLARYWTRYTPETVTQPLEQNFGCCPDLHPYSLQPYRHWPRHKIKCVDPPQVHSGLYWADHLLIEAWVKEHHQRFCLINNRKVGSAKHSQLQDTKILFPK
jgi:hypothetical protein